MNCKDCLYQMINGRCGLNKCPYKKESDQEDTAK